MPTVDAEPQNHQWINTYSTADAVFAYSEFGRDTMLNQSNKIKFVDIASPCASDKFYPIEDKANLRKEFGIDPNAIIFGTVMRNQRRKLYPDLFKAFRMFLDNNPSMTNVYLYCHTGYPDVGWEIPDLIKEIRDNGTTVIITTHYMDEAEVLCDRVAIIDSGKIIAINTPNHLIDELVETGFEKVKEVKKANLEDVFIHLTGKALREE
jgi:glycosyltransferase involved in cell wall biosynthesis